MKKNESNIDRNIRVVIGIALLTLSLSQIVSGAPGVVFIVLGAVALLTGAIGFCPLYTLLKISTLKS